ncbi:MAG TPA: amidase [Solirubrobacterales bacterium]|nr:amidase [Solirubrobacterales bacterium]
MSVITVTGDEVAFAGAARIAELVRAKEISPSELVETYLERISRIDPKLNAYRVVLGDQARADAKRAEERLAAGDEAPLLGVPVAIKDNVDYAGEVTTHGTAAYGEPAREDSVIVRRLREAGAVILGKTNLPELAIYGFTESPTWGDTRNPWDPSRTCGGSSGGSGVAVAAGMAAIAHATDGAGSIRYPAAYCGLFGLKPQRNRISLSPDREHWHGLSVSGCNSRTVMDTALYLDAVGGAERGDFDSPPPFERPLAEAARTKPGKLRIACTTKTILPVPKADEVIAAYEETIGLLRSLGHEVTEAAPKLGAMVTDFYPLYFRGIRDEAMSLPHPERLSDQTKGFVRLGRLFSDRRLAKVRDRMPAASARIQELWRDHDVLLTPATAQLPVKIGHWRGKGALRTINGMSNVYPYAAAWNYTGQPAATIPAGFTVSGLPRSVMLIARPNDEATLVSLGAQIEAERPWADRTPDV